MLIIIKKKTNTILDSYHATKCRILKMAMRLTVIYSLRAIEAIIKFSKAFCSQ